MQDTQVVLPHILHYSSYTNNIRLRCNRVNPCDSCQRRGIRERCDLPDTNEPATASWLNNAKSADQRDRLDRLERIIISLANAERDEHNIATHSDRNFTPSRTSHNAANISSDPVADSLPASSFDNSGGKATYSGATHWVTIINEVRPSSIIIDLK